jgi:hypothetical protein
MGDPTYSVVLADTLTASLVLDEARDHVALRAARQRPVPLALARRSREPGPHRTGLLRPGVAKLVDYGDVIQPMRGVGAQTDALAIEFPRDARRPVTFEIGAVRVGVTLIGADESRAEAASGYVVYRDAFGRGSHVLHRPSADGDEDFMLLETAPSDSTVRYAISLGQGVAGLRLVANTLEILDAGGAPRLRMAAPYLVSADGRTVPAEVALSGCVADRSMLSPWDRSPTSPGSDSCTVSLHWAADAVAYPAILDPSWTSAGSMSVPRVFHTATTLANGRVLVTGGDATTAAPYLVHQTSEIFDPATWTWSMAAPLAQPRTQHTATLLSSGAVLVAGGFDVRGVSTSSCELYDPSLGIWTPAASMAATRYDYTATRLNDGTVLVAAGVVADDWGASAERYSPATNTWAPTGSLHGAFEAHAASLLQNGGVLVTGGEGATFRAAAEVYDPLAGVWSVVAPMSTSRMGHTSQTLLNGKVLVAGGVADASYSPLATTELFDTATGTWTAGPAMSVGRLWASMNRLSNGSVFEAGGYIGGAWTLPTSFTGAAEIYLPATNQWTTTSTMAGTRFLHGASAFTNNRVLVTGGSNETGVLATAESFQPDLACTTCFPIANPPSNATLATMQGETAISINAYQAQTIATVFYNDFTGTDSVYGNGKIVQYATTPPGRRVYRGASLFGWSYSTDLGTTWTHGKIDAPPSGWAVLWGDPAATSSFVHRNYVFASNLAIPDDPVHFPAVGYIEGTLNRQPQPYFGGACIARSNDGGKTFTIDQTLNPGSPVPGALFEDCVHTANYDFYDGASMVSDASGAIYAAFENVGVNPPRIDVYRAANHLSEFVLLANPFGCGSIAAA